MIMTAILDHLAIGTPALSPGWELFGGILGGAWDSGGDSPGYWWGEVAFASGPKIELLTPTGGPDAAFLERFLARSGAGPHHFNFHVSDIEDTLARVRAHGIEPVGVNLDNANWKEAFLHPRDVHGIVIQVAEEESPSRSAPPAELGQPGAPSRLDLIEHRVGDLDRAVRLFRDVLEGQLEQADAGRAELTWAGGSRVRLVREEGLRLDGALHHVRFSREAGSFSAAERERAGELAKQLGMTLDLAG